MFVNYVWISAVQNHLFQVAHRQEMYGMRCVKSQVDWVVHLLLSVIDIL